MSKILLATVTNPKTNRIHVDDPYCRYEEVDEVPYGSVLVDLNALNTALGPKDQNNSSSKAASIKLDHVFFNSEEEGGIMANEMAAEYFEKLRQSKAASAPGLALEKVKEVMTNRKYRNIQSLMIMAKSQLYHQRASKAGAVITSLDFPNAQSLVNVGGNTENFIRTGILASLFQTVNMPNLSGKWISQANDLKYYRNLMETETPEPSKGSGSTVTITVQKHGGAVAITQRAQMVINDDDPFARLVTQMGQKKLFDENDMVADEIESNTGTTISGVDFGIRSGTPPASTQNPIDFLISLQTTWASKSQPLNLLVSRGLMFWEFTYNDIIRGGQLAGTPAPSLGAVDESVSGMPVLDGVRWARDNAITSTTAGWAMNDNAIKLFRGPRRNYTISDEDTETTKYVTKNYFMPETVDTSLIVQMTGIAA